MSARQDTCLEKRVCLHFFAFFDVLLGSNLLAKVGQERAHTHTHTAWSPMSKPCLDYNTEPSAPKNRYRNTVKVGVITQVTPQIFLFVSGRVVYFLSLHHASFPTWTTFCLHSLEPVKWFLHLHKVSHPTSYLFIYRRLFMCHTEAPGIWMDAKNAMCLKENCSQLPLGAQTTSWILHKLNFMSSITLLSHCQGSDIHCYWG